MVEFSLRESGFQECYSEQSYSRRDRPFALGINIILWVPRETRGYSVGGVVSDPRTGEILKAIIRLDAMRMPADRLLLDALTSPYTDQPYLATRDEVLRRRFRLLVAHEIGHPLGLRHQFIASAQGMSSVMDYPFPYSCSMRAAYRHCTKTHFQLESAPGIRPRSSTAIIPFGPRQKKPGCTLQSKQQSAKGSTG